MPAPAFRFDRVQRKFNSNYFCARQRRHTQPSDIKDPARPKKRRQPFEHVPADATFVAHSPCGGIGTPRFKSNFRPTIRQKILARQSS
jgi:hypothetical protein